MWLERERLQVFSAHMHHMKTESIILHVLQTLPRTVLTGGGDMMTGCFLKITSLMSCPENPTNPLNHVKPFFPLSHDFSPREQVKSEYYHSLIILSHQIFVIMYTWPMLSITETIYAVINTCAIHACKIQADADTERPEDNSFDSLCRLCMLNELDHILYFTGSVLTTRQLKSRNVCMTQLLVHSSKTATGL